jgi:predicted permease
MKSGIRGSSGGADGAALRRVLVVAQVACSLFLLFGGLLFAATLRNVLAVDPGFDAGQVSVARLDFSSMMIPSSARAPLVSDLLDRIRQAPGVTSAAEVRHVPMGGSGSSVIVTPDGGDSTVKLAARLNAMSPGYLRTMGIALIAGRDVDSRDSSAAPKVAIVNRTFARRLGLAGSPVGQRFRGQTSPTTSDEYEIVGLVPDSKYFTLREDPLPIAFVPVAQIVDPRPVADVMVRSDVPAALTSSLERIVAEVSPLIAVDVRALESTIRDGVVRERLMAGLSGAFGVLAALIAAVGVYGVMSYLVLRRTGEFGVRLALGAQRRDVRRLVLREALVLLAIGLAIGSAGAFAAAGSASSLVFGLPPRDGWTLGLACLLLGATAMTASWLPARRAAALQPLRALREE